MGLPIQFTEKGRDTLRALDILVQRRVKAAVKTLARKPGLGKRLLGRLEGFLSYPIGKYRVIYSFNDTHLIVHRTGHRGDVYEKMVEHVLQKTKDKQIKTMADLRPFLGTISKETGEAMERHIAVGAQAHVSAQVVELLGVLGRLIDHREDLITDRHQRFARLLVPIRPIGLSAPRIVVGVVNTHVGLVEHLHEVQKDVLADLERIELNGDQRHSGASLRAAAGQ